MTNQKVWNPLNKQYWTKENLKPDIKTAKSEFQKAKTEFQGIKEEIKGIDWSEKTEGQIKAEKFAEKLSRIGWKLTLVLTVPIVLTLFFGVFGLVVGVIIAAFALMKKEK